MTDEKLVAYDREVALHQKRNFWCNVLDGNFWDFGTSFIAFGTVIPVFILKLGGNNLVVSLIPFLTIIGLNLPAVFFIHYIENLDKKKPFVLFTGSVLRFAWLLVAVACFFLAEHHPRSMLVILMACIVFFFAVDGSAIPAWFDLVAKTVPVRIRGRMMAIRSMGGSILGAIGGIITAATLTNVLYPHNYSVLFFAAFALYMLSIGCIAFIHEPVYPHKPPKKDLRGGIKALYLAVKGNRDFSTFIIVRAAATIVSASTAFFVVYATSRYRLPASYSGVFTTVIIVSMVAFGPVAGILADRKGNKVNFVVCLAACCAAACVVFFTRGIWWFYPALVLLGIAQIALQVSDLPIIVEFCPVQDRPVYLAACQVAMAPVAMLSLGFGSLADHAGYQSLFIVIGALAFAGLAFTLSRLKDPRRNSTVSAAGTAT